MPNVMAALRNISGAYKERKFRTSLPCHTPQCLADVYTARVSCNIRERKIWTHGEFSTWQNCLRGREPPKMYIQCIPAQETAKHPAKFGWRPLSDVGAVTLPRRETRWNLLGCLKLTNRSQPLVSKFTILSGHVENILLFNKFFPIVDTCLSCEDIAGQICAMVRRRRFFCIIFAFCIFTGPRAGHFRHAL